MMTQGLLYQNIAQKIKNDILDGTYPVGSLLPTEVQLEAIFGVSKITVRQAVQILSDEGYVEKRSGKGTKVISNRLFNKLSKAVSYSSILETQHQLEKELLSFEKVNLDSTDPLYAAFGTQAHRLKRIYRLDGRAFIYFEHFFPVLNETEAHALDMIKENSIYRLLSTHHLEVASFKDEFEVVQVSSDIQSLLHLDKDAVLKRKRLSMDASGKLVEISYGYYNTQVKPYIIEYEI